METAIEVDGLVVDRGGRRVLHGLDFAVRRGSVTGLLGPNGSGKTTLMRCVVGVQKVRAGKVTVLGEVAGAPALRRRVGYVTQAPSVYADLTVRENARYFASLYRLPHTTADEAVHDVGLDAVAGQLVAALSGGERFHALAGAGTTLLVSSHVLDEAGRCDRLLLIRDGRLVADDTPDAVRRQAGTSDLETAFLRMVLAGEESGPQPKEAV